MTDNLKKPDSSNAPSSLLERDISGYSSEKNSMFISGAKRRLKTFMRFASAFFPLAICNTLVIQVWPISFPVSYFIAYYYARGNNRNTVKNSPKVRISSFVYWAPVLACMYIYLRMLLRYYPHFLIPVIAYLVFLRLRKRWSQEALSGIFLLVLFLFFHVSFEAPTITAKSMERIKNEKFIKPLFLFKENPATGSNQKIEKLDGVRMILAAPDESALYFTADAPEANEENKDSRPSCLYRIDLNDISRITSFSSPDRIFGLSFMPGEEQLLATSFFEDKLLLINPQTLQLIDSRDTGEKPQFIVTDAEGGALTVSHESKGAMIGYSIPELTRTWSSEIISSPAKLVVDHKGRQVFAANWMAPYLLTENSYPSMSILRKKLLFSGISGGIDLDRTRDRIYITAMFTGWVFGVDRKTFKVVHKFKTLPLARAICVDELRQLIFVGNVVDPYVRIYDFNGKYITRVYTGATCREIYQTPGSGRVFVGSSMGVFEIMASDISDKFK